MMNNFNYLQNSDNSSVSFMHNTAANDDKKRIELLLMKLKNQEFKPMEIWEALSATGISDVRAAAQWIFSHKSDPLLNTGKCREFLLYLCPVGDLATAVEDFWASQRASSGWTRAMECPPHITLVSPFRVPAQKFPDVYHAFNAVCRFYAERCLLNGLPLRIQSAVRASSSGITGNFVSLFLNNNASESALVDLANAFGTECSNKGLGPFEMASKPLKMNLAYRFPPAELQSLQRIVNETFNFTDDSDVLADCEWQIRLYSRDERLNEDPQLYCTRYEGLAEDKEKLEFAPGDRVALLSSVDPPQHGWGQGYNLDTGLEGSFPLRSAIRIPCSAAWTLHKIIKVSQSTPGSPLCDSSLSSGSFASFSRQNSSSGGQNGDSLSSSHVAPLTFSRMESFPADHKSITPERSSSWFGIASFLQQSPAIFSLRQPSASNRQLHIMRHGERVDASLGFTWIRQAFTHNGVFNRRFDLNLPDDLPSRHPEDFDNDPPITLIGQFLAYQAGVSLRNAGIRYACVFSSPSLRCVQTAHHLLTGLGQTLAVRVEPGLYEPAGGNTPVFMSLMELRRAGLHVDLEYKGDNKATNPEKYPENLAKLVRKLGDYARKKGGHVLIVGHRTTVEFGPTALIHPKQPLRLSGLPRRAGVPYGAFVAMEERRNKGWSLVEPPAALKCTVSEHSNFDWTELSK